jgi:hypothetical protein
MEKLLEKQDCLTAVRCELEDAGGLRNREMLERRVTRG